MVLRAWSSFHVPFHTGEVPEQPRAIIETTVATAQAKLCFFMSSEFRIPNCQRLREPCLRSTIYAIL